MFYFEMFKIMSVSTDCNFFSNRATVKSGRAEKSV